MMKTARKKTFHPYSVRLETFYGAKVKGSKPRSRKVTWPHDKPSANDVASAGFYFTPAPGKYSGDMVTCYMCACGIDGWEENDEPKKIHFDVFPACPLAWIQAKAWEHEIDHDPRSDDALSLRLQTYYQPLTSEEVDEKLNSAKGEEEPSLSHLMGFPVWPHEGKKGWIPTCENMARAGFYFNPQNSGDDFVECPYCKLGLEGWEPGDDPVVEHKRRSPECLMFTVDSDIPLLKSSVSAHKRVTQRELEESDDDLLLQESSSAAFRHQSKSPVKSVAKQKPKSQPKKRNSGDSFESENEDLGSDDSMSRKVRKVITTKTKITREATFSVHVGPSNIPISSPDPEDQDELGFVASRSPRVPLSKGSVMSKVSKFEDLAATPQIGTGSQFNSPTRSPGQKTIPSPSQKSIHSPIQKTPSTESRQKFQAHYALQANLNTVSSEPSSAKRTPINPVGSSPLVASASKSWEKSPSPDIYHDAHDVSSPTADDEQADLAPPTSKSENWETFSNSSLDFSPPPPKLRPLSPHRSNTPTPAQVSPAKSDTTPGKKTTPVRGLATPAGSEKWTPIDPDQVFEVLASVSSDFGISLNKEEFLDMTVKEFFAHMANIAESQLRSKSEEYVKLFESEGLRSKKFLENLPISD